MGTPLGPGEVLIQVINTKIMSVAVLNQKKFSLNEDQGVPKYRFHCTFNGMSSTGEEPYNMQLHHAY